MSDQPPEPPATDDDAFVPMRVGGVVIDPNTQVPVLILRGYDEPRLYVPIFIGGLEATAIATALAGVEMPRPMTHDLMVSVLDAVACRVVGVGITRLDGGTFFAEIRLADETDTELVLDARPSDAIALALRARAPITVASSVIEQAGALAPEEDVAEGQGASPEDPEDVPDVPPEPEVPESGGSEDKKRPLADGPRSFFGDVKLEDLIPEDFGKYKM